MFRIDPNVSTYEDVPKTLTSVTLTKIKAVSSYMFAGATSLTEIVLPDTVTSIGQYAFKSCTSLTSFVLPGSVKTIYDTAFAGCDKLEVINVTDLAAFCAINVSTDSTYAEAIRLLSDITVYVNGTALTSLSVPNGVTAMGNIFRGYTALTSVTLPTTLSAIPDRAFEDCVNLESVSIPEGCTQIGSYAFMSCTKLETITLPASLTSIGNKAFYQSALTTAYFEGDGDWTTVGSFPQSITNATLSDPATAANYLTTKYVNLAWSLK